MDPYLSISKQHTEDPLPELTTEPEQQLKDMVQAATNFSTNINALLAEVSQSAVAGPSQTWVKREEGEEGEILEMENPDQGCPSPPHRKHAHRMAPTGIVRKSVCV